MRHAKAVLQGGFADNRQPMLDPSIGGQFGMMTDLKNWVSNAVELKGQLYAVVLDVPKGFHELPGSEHYIRAFKTMWMQDAQTIEGLDATLNTEFAETPVGSAGEMQETLSNVTRNRSVPVLGLPERLGKPYQALLTDWITLLGLDPETNIPGLAAYKELEIDVLTPDWNTATVAFFTTDPTFRYVQDAWIVTNMFPKSAGEVTARKDLSAGKEALVHSIEWTGMAQVGMGPKSVCQGLLDSISLRGVSPVTAPGIMEEVNALVADQDVGMREHLRRAASESLV